MSYEAIFPILEKREISVQLGQEINAKYMHKEKLRSHIALNSDIESIN